MCIWCMNVNFEKFHAGEVDIKFYFIYILVTLYFYIFLYILNIFYDFISIMGYIDPKDLNPWNQGLL